MANMRKFLGYVSTNENKRDSDPLSLPSYLKNTSGEDPNKNRQTSDAHKRKRDSGGTNTTGGRRTSNEPATVAPTPQVEDDNVDIEYDEEWMQSFRWIKIFLLVFGRWPLTYKQDEHHRGYVFKFSWKCPGFLIYFVTTVFTLYGLIAGGINVVQVLMKEKIAGSGSGNRTNTEIFEQALAERHTMILIVILGAYGINAIISMLILIKRHEIADMFTKWTRFLHLAKLSGGTYRTYYYVGMVAGVYAASSLIFIILTLFRTTHTETATFIGGPTVVSMLFMRHFNPPNYLENFVGTTRHYLMHYVGLCIFFYVITTCNAFIYMFLWLLNSMENAYSCWNGRMATVTEYSAEEIKSQTSTKDRTTFEALYHDHIGLVKMLAWFNNMFAYSLEPYVLLITIKIVYQIYLAVIVVETNGKPLTKINVGKYFIRKNDYIAAVLMTIENCFTLFIMLMASSRLEDIAYDSYEDLRKKSLLKGVSGERESFFFLSMFQSYTSTTKMAVYGANFFSIDRYSILHVLSAIMSNFLVVYQFRPLFDMDTVGAEFEGLRNLTGQFLADFEGLPYNHTIPGRGSI